MPAAARIALACVLVAPLSGCAPAPSPPAAPKAAHADHDHDGHEHPQTLDAGVAELAETAAAVKKNLGADARDDADEAVHAMAHLLEDLQGLVRTSGLATEAKAAASAALDDLFDCFDKLDTALHAEPGKGPSPAEVHASITDRVDAAIKALRDAGAAAVPAGDDAAAAIIRDAKKSEEDR